MSQVAPERFSRVDLRGLTLGADPVEFAGEVGRIADHLRAGGVIVCPTETVYGFSSAVTSEGIAALRALKRRPDAKPLLALVPDRATTETLAWTGGARELADLFWPGALTLVLRDPDGRFPDGVRGPEGTVAVRWSPSPVVRAVLNALGAPITSSSANAPGEPPAGDAQSAAEALAALDADPAKVLVVDAGVLPTSAPSTLVDCTGPVPRLLREGAIPLARLRCLLPDLDSTES